MQVYRDLDIGTAKATVADRNRIPHHLIDILSIQEPYNAARFAEDATQALNQIAARGKPALVVGGTGLYAKTLIYGLDLEPADQDLAMELLELYATEEGKSILAKELIAAGHRAHVDLGDLVENPRRLLRAIEVVRLTGKLPKQLRVKTKPPTSMIQQYILMPDVDWLRSRVQKRTRAMIAAGWVDETRALIQRGFLETPTASHALGYRDVGKYLNGELTDIEDLAGHISRRTLRYARRQRTWFRHQHPGATILSISDDTDLQRCVDTVTDFLTAAQTNNQCPRR